ncbi:MAG: FecCD family ABC transporter permease [Polyangiales bacterium]
MLRRRAFVILALTACVAAAVAWWALCTGPVPLHRAAWRHGLWPLRGVRVVAAFITGAALAVSGALVQGLFRNPLASPSILGTTAGASLGGQLALGLHAFGRYRGAGAAGRAAGLDGIYWVPVGALLGAGLSLVVLQAFARRRYGLLGLLLAGFVLSSFWLSLGTLGLSLVQERFELSRAVLSFVLGGLEAVDARQLRLLWPLVLAGVVAAWSWGRALDVMLAGEEEAGAFGVPTLSLRRWVVLWTAVLTGAAVALAGNVGFVGLLAPHAMRPVVGPQHRPLVLASALMGGTLLLVCDQLVRALPTPSELPLGVITGLLGAPMFLLLLRHLQGDSRRV